MLYTTGSIVSVFMCGQCPFFVVDHVRFFMWIVSIFTCGPCPFFRVDRVRFLVWIMSTFACGLCPLSRVDRVHYFARKYNKALLVRIVNGNFREAAETRLGASSNTGNPRQAAGIRRHLPGALFLGQFLNEEIPVRAIIACSFQYSFSHRK